MNFDILEVKRLEVKRPEVKALVTVLQHYDWHSILWLHHR